MQSFYVVEAVVVAALLAFLAYQSRSWPKRIPGGRVPFVDFLKGLAIVCVVGIHAVNLFPSLLWINAWLWAGLAFFVLASGYVLSLSYLDTFEPRRYFSRMGTRLLAPYLVISILVLLLTRIPLSGYPAALLFGRANGNYYFIPLLAGLYLVFPLLRLVAKQLFSPVGMVVTYLVSLYFWSLHYNLSLVAWNANEWSLIFFGRYLFFFIMGMYLSRFDLDQVSTRSILMAIGAYLAAVFGMYAWLHWPYQLLYYPVPVVLALLLLYRLRPSFWAPFTVIGPHTLYIYLLHSPLVFNWGGPQFAAWWPGPAWLGLILLIAAVTALMYGAALLIEKGVAWAAARRKTVT